ncbi:hypothetical protein PR048_028597 [Dryococelus australis]|uniref:Uncharacterized protein n=1 Tax=Dryococelus australis TaxID=614101 RepID=A0ABQ9GB09_9NEOP|nr:hypothetical protein PR048_028597 [Dryococelus australis]
MMPDDAAGRRVFSGISHFPSPLHSDTASFSSFIPISPKDLIMNRRNLSTRQENEDGDILSFDLQEMLVGDEKEARKLLRGNAYRIFRRASLLNASILPDVTLCSGLCWQTTLDFLLLGRCPVSLCSLATEVRKFNKGGDLMEMCDGLLPLTNGSTAAYEELEIFRERNCCHVGMAILYGFDNMLILLLDLGLDPNTRVNHWYHYSLLHMAAIDGSLRIARSLLDHDADPKRRDNLSFLPIHLAELNVNKPVYKLLLDYLIYFTSHVDAPLSLVLHMPDTNADSQTPTRNVENGAASKCKGGGNMRSLRKPCRPAASSITISTCENPGVAPPRIDPTSQARVARPSSRLEGSRPWQQELWKQSGLWLSKQGWWPYLFLAMPEVRCDIVAERTTILAVQSGKNNIKANWLRRDHQVFKRKNVAAMKNEHYINKEVPTTKACNFTKECTSQLNRAEH